jgi:LEA14-like dessication related protein
MKAPGRGVHTTPGCALLVCLLAGCALPALVGGRFVEPEVTLSRSKVDSLSSSAAHVVFGLQVYNPNPYTLRLRGCRLGLTVGGTAIAAGETAHGVSVPARGSGTLDVSMEVNWGQLLAAAQDAIMIGEIPYQLDGSLRFGVFLWQREIRFVRSSVLRLNLPLGLASVARLSAQWRVARDRGPERLSPAAACSAANQHVVLGEEDR